MEPTQDLAITRKSRQTMLPLLVVLFLISYVLLTTLVVLQDRTIDSQRGLIHLLFSDNLHLVAAKVGLQKNTQAHANQMQTASTQPPSTQAPLAQAPSKQVPATTPSAQTQTAQVPVIQAKPEANRKAGQKHKAQKALPLRPPVEVTDPSDTRRVSLSI